ncbi:MAG: diacylglyceryl transferase [Flavobacteriia bacterium]|nr:diacylglyceryl transferase [Flavobacteriia bacterium]
MKQSFFNRLKERWGIDSNLSIILILIVFALTGSSAVKLARPLLDFIGLHKDNFESTWYFLSMYWVLRVLVIFPIYQILLVCFGWLFGQFSFFWNFEKKMLKRMGLGFLLKD